MTLTERKRRSEYLKRGDIQKLSKASGISSQAIGKWIKGEFEKSSAEKMFIVLTDKREQQFNEFLSTDISA